MFVFFPSVFAYILRTSLYCSNAIGCTAIDDRFVLSTVKCVDNQCEASFEKTVQLKLRTSGGGGGASRVESDKIDHVLVYFILSCLQAWTCSADTVIKFSFLETNEFFIIDK